MYYEEAGPCIGFGFSYDPDVDGLCICGIRIARFTPKLSFSGNTATCSVSCRGDTSKDKIEAALTLYQGDTCVDSWSNSGAYRISISESYKVASGKS